MKPYHLWWQEIAIFIGQITSIVSQLSRIVSHTKLMPGNAMNM